jgi:hypothetical protein
MVYRDASSLISASLIQHSKTVRRASVFLGPSRVCVYSIRLNSAKICCFGITNNRKTANPSYSTFFSSALEMSNFRTALLPPVQVTIYHHCERLPSSKARATPYVGADCLQDCVFERSPTFLKHR